MVAIKWFIRFLNNRLRYEVPNKIETAEKLRKINRIKQNKKISFIVVSDIDNKKEEMLKELKLLEHKDYSFIVSLGDIEIEALKELVSFSKEHKKLLYSIRGNHDTYKFEDIDDYIINIDEKIIDFKGFKFMGVEGTEYYNDYSTWKNDEDLFYKNFKEEIDVLFSHTKASSKSDKDKENGNRGLLGINKILANCGVFTHIYGHFHDNGKKNNIQGTKSFCSYEVQLVTVRY